MAFQMTRGRVRSRVNGEGVLNEDSPATMPMQSGFMSDNQEEETLGHEAPVSNRTAPNHLLRYGPGVRRRSSCKIFVASKPAEIAGAGN